MISEEISNDIDSLQKSAYAELILLIPKHEISCTHIFDEMFVDLIESLKASHRKIMNHCDENGIIKFVSDED